MKCGLGITTYNRPAYFKQCIDHVIKYTKSSVDFIVVVNDGSGEEYEKEYQEIYSKLPKEIRIIHQKENGGCSKAKNILLKEMIKEGCEDLFICEDDILIRNEFAIPQYIKVAREYGFHNLCYALHGPINIGKRLPIPGEVAYYPDSVGAFCYYTREVIAEVGGFDEEFHNAMEHVELTDRIARVGKTLSFSMFVDIANSDQYISEIKGSIENSSIRPKVETEEETLKFRKNIYAALCHWKEKDGERFPLWDLYFNFKKLLEGKGKK